MSRRTIVTAVIVVAVGGLFTWEWLAAPRVKTSPQIERRLETTKGDLYLGSSYEGLALRTVRPYYYSDCIPGKPHPVPCRWVRVSDGVVTGSDPKQVERARSSLRRVG